MNRNKILAVILFLFGIAFSLLVKFNLTLGVDMFIYNTLISFESNTLTSIFKVITFLGSTRFILALNIISVLLMVLIRKKELFIIPTNSILSVIFNRAIKSIIKRPRPKVKRLVKESFYSFPSGHAMISILFYGTLIILISKHIPKYKNIINTFILLIILLIGVSRIYLGVHYASDIIGGYLIGGSILLFSKESLYESINNRG